METDSEENYNPADDDNQGVVQLMAQAEQANEGVGVEQNPPMSLTGNSDGDDREVE